jgi:S1-C subfamily serine protease
MSLRTTRSARLGLLALAAALTGSLATGPARAEPSVEPIFAAARSYTAYVRTRIQLPYIEDEQQAQIGAAFLVDRNRGWLLTNAHVTGHSPGSVDVAFIDGRSRPARPVYIDPYLDVAVLEVADRDGLTDQVATLDCGPIPSVGHPVGAFGHPEDLRFTGTRGIISGFTARFGEDRLQTDAPINPGNSGGPLISLETGKVVGINTDQLAGDKVQNANFAVLARQVCHILELLQAGRDPTPPDLGVTYFVESDEPTLKVARLGLAATASGLQRYDRVVSVDNVPLDWTTEGALLDRLRGATSSTTLQVERAGKQVSLRPTLRPALSPLRRTGLYVAGALLSVSTLRNFDFNDMPTALMVHFVEDGSPANAAGLQVYDHLIAVNGRKVTSLDELAAALKGAPDDRPTTLELLRLVDREDRFLESVLAPVVVDEVRKVAYGKAAGR